MTRPFTLIAGPCSAESRAQVLSAAQGLKATGLDYFRAGIWKPRTRPGAFEGVGSTGLPWLQEVQREVGLKVCIEVAKPRHIEEALKAGIDMLWVGARTTANPFQVQDIADALHGVDIPVAVKNPTGRPRLVEWCCGTVAAPSIEVVMAIHRGFTVPDEEQPPVANSHCKHPDIPLLEIRPHCERPWFQMSPVGGPGFDGLMVEVHPDPDVKWTDAAQQVTPARFLTLVASRLR